ncbi:hypothetical protein [Coleofasciculus chthonoplastes]
MLLQQEKLQHLNSIAHEGKVVVFATDADGEIHYTIKMGLRTAT